ncbi:MAG: hypothetical protein WAT39_07280 [Planctomycetota bacterium]
MNSSLAAPSAGEGTCALADYMELCAIKAGDRNTSIQDLVQDLKRSGTSVSGEDELDDDESAGPADLMVEAHRVQAEEAFAELDDRWIACGSDRAAYPFSLLDRALQANAVPQDSIYLFLLLLAKYGKDAGPKHSFPERTFEELCAHAAAGYFGGAALGGQAVRFGHPRRGLPTSFHAALHEVCRRVGEGAARDAPRPGVKDGKLDVICWRPFPDGRQGILLGFGQCATGWNEWQAKAGELQPQSFMDKFMAERFAVPPTRLFFVPWRVERSCWRDCSCDGGILFDRCRIALLTKDVDASLRTECSTWSRYVLKKEIGA